MAGELSRAWEGAYGAPPGALAADLRKLGELFGPRVSAERLGRLIRTLPSNPPGPASARIYPSLLLQVGEGVLVTLEGRVALELLTTQPGLTAAAAAREVERHPAVVETYRQWAHERLATLIATEEGRGEKMYPVAIGATLLLMIRGTDSEARALELPERGSPLDAALMRPVLTMNAEIAKGHHANLKTAFRDTPIKKAERRLGSRLVVQRPRKFPWRVWLPSDGWDDILRILADELIRRRGLVPSQADAVLGKFSSAYDEVSQHLTDLGVVRSRSADNQIINRLRREIQRQSSH